MHNIAGQPIPRLPNGGQHPECREDELFLANLTPRILDYLPWESLRTGKRAIVRNGGLADGQIAHGFLPAFVNKGEYAEYWIAVGCQPFMAQEPKAVPSDEPEEEQLPGQVVQSQAESLETVKAAVDTLTVH